MRERFLEMVWRVVAFHLPLRLDFGGLGPIWQHCNICVVFQVLYDKRKVILSSNMQ